MQSDLELLSSVYLRYKCFVPHERPAIIEDVQVWIWWHVDHSCTVPTILKALIEDLIFLLLLSIINSVEIILDV